MAYLHSYSVIEFFQNEGQIRYDEIVRKDLPLLEKFNEMAYKRYIRTAKISDVLEKETILVNLNCAEIVDGIYYFTNAGALFFRLNEDDVKYRHAGIVCALYKGTEKANIIDAKELNGDAVSNIDDAIIFLKRHLNISYKIKTLQRESILELPEDALREAIVNAICHRNYFEKGARVMVEIFDDRVEITSPGGVCKGITAENFGKISITRNSVVASLLQMIGYIEQMGTGIIRMKNATREAHVASPEFEFKDFFKVIFKRKEIDIPSIAQTYVSVGSDRTAIENKKPAIDSDRTAIKNKKPAIDSDRTAIENKKPAIDSDRTAIENKKPAIDSDRTAIKNKKTAIDSDRIFTILEYLKQNGRGKNVDFSNLFGLSSQRTREIIQEMIQKKLIEKQGDKRFTYYVLKK
ncbi:MAG: hypothetical protein FWG98_08955 [Candidatus Cloacimonetes bacterium]|nr:hypothetical protein [Candidatus Cloacimonadota bacterium]